MAQTGEIWPAWQFIFDPLAQMLFYSIYSYTNCTQFSSGAKVKVMQAPQQKTLPYQTPWDCKSQTTVPNLSLSA